MHCVRALRRRRRLPPCWPASLASPACPQYRPCPCRAAPCPWLAGWLILTAPGVTFDDIAGHERAKQLLHEAVALPLILPEFFTGEWGVRVGWGTDSRGEWRGARYRTCVKGCVGV